MAEFKINDNRLEKYEYSAYSDSDAVYVIVPEGVKTIGSGAFQYKNIISAVLPEGVEKVEYNAFNRCETLQRVVLPSTLKTIEDRAFWGCEALTEVTVSSNIDNLGMEVFYRCGPIKFIAEKQEYIDSVCKNDFVIANGTLVNFYGSRKCVVVPDGVVKVSGAFFNNESVESVILPATVETIDQGSFDSCKNLLEITMPEKALKGNLFKNESKTLLLKLINDEKTTKIIACFKSSFLTEDAIPLYPSDAEHTAKYDKLVAYGSGRYDEYQMREDWRIKAAMWRLNDIENPVAKRENAAMKSLLKDKANKAINYAIENKSVEDVKLLMEIGVINDKNKKRVQKKLAESQVRELQSIEL